MAGRKRDFRESTIGTLGSDLRAGIIDADCTSGWDSGHWTALFCNNLGINALEEDMSNVDKYLKQVCEVNDITSDRFEQIITNVRAVETAYAGKFTEGKEALGTLRKVFERFIAEMNGNFPASVDFTSLLEDINGTLAGNSAYIEAALQAERDKMQNPDGSYNWEYISELMNSDPASVSSIQYLALGMLYLDMDNPEDMQTLINYGYIELPYDDNMGATNFGLSPVFGIMTLTLQYLVCGADQANIDIMSLSDEETEKLLKLGMLLDVCTYAPTVKVAPDFIAEMRDGNFPVRIDYFSAQDGYCLCIQTPPDKAPEVMEPGSKLPNHDSWVFDKPIYICGRPPLPGDVADWVNDEEAIDFMENLAGGTKSVWALLVGTGIDYAVGAVSGAIATAMAIPSLGMSIGIKVVTTGVKQLLDYIKLEAKKAGVASVSATMRTINCIQMLGGDVQYSYTGNGSYTIRYIYFDPKDVWLRTQVYNQRYGTNYTPEDLMSSAMTGEPEGIWDRLIKDEEKIGESGFKKLADDYEKELGEKYVDAKYPDQTNLTVADQDAAKAEFDNLSMEELQQFAEGGTA